jgi:hypothetical protein
MIRLTRVLLGALVLASAAVDAQTVARVRGTIAAMDASVLAVKTADGRNVLIHLVDKTVIVYAQPMTLGDIKPGDFLAVSSTRGADGTLTAYEVRRFPKPLNPGHGPLDGRSDQTMTNATVSAMVQSASGRELTLSYGDSTQKILVPESASISMLVPGERAQLVPGAAVNLTASPGADGALTAVRVQVSPVK